MGARNAGNATWTVNKESIRLLARKIVRLARPLKVVLFGSHAWGRPTADSDVDILLIVRTRRDLTNLGAEIAHAANPPFPLDLIVKTPAEVRWRLKERDCFLTEVFRRGTILYEARNARVG